MSADQIIEAIRNANTALARKDIVSPDQLRIYHNMKRKALKEFKEKTKPLTNIQYGIPHHQP